MYEQVLYGNFGTGIFYATVGAVVVGVPRAECLFGLRMNPSQPNQQILTC